MPPPILETERLLLRPFTRDDFDLLHSRHQDPQVVQYLLYSEPWTRETQETWLAELLGHYEADAMGHVALIRKSDGVLVGRSGLSSWLIEGEVELGYTLWREFWGMGYATEGSQRWRDYAYEELQLPRLISLIQKENAGSMKVAQRNGFAYESDIPRHNRTFTIWAQSREQWQASR